MSTGCLIRYKRRVRARAAALDVSRTTNMSAHSGMSTNRDRRTTDQESSVVDERIRKKMRSLLLRNKKPTSEFDKCVQRLPKGLHGDVLLKLIGKRIVREACERKKASVDGVRTQVVGDGDHEETPELRSWQGIHVKWFLDVFCKTPYAKAFINFGCPMWFIRNVCITEMLRQEGVTSGALIHHVDNLYADNSDNDVASDHEAVGKATTFVSYTGSYTLPHFAELLGKLDKDEYVWIDVFCVDQFAWTERKDDEMMLFKQNFMYELRDKIREIGNTVLFLGDWNKLMVTFGKIWVVWEIHATVIGKAQLRVLLSTTEAKRYVLKGLLSADGAAEIQRSLAKIDANNAEAWDPNDKKLILGLMNESNGVFHVNVGVIRRMQEWLVETGKGFLEEFRNAGDAREWDLANNLSVLYSDLGRHSEAVSLRREVLDFRRENLGNEHPKTLSSISNLASLLTELGDFLEAESLCQEATGGRLEQLGSDHPETLSSINNLAILRQNQGNLSEAAQIHREALEVRRENLGSKHPDTLQSIHNLAAVLFARGELAEAEKLCHEYLETKREQGLGNKHPDTLSAINNLAGVLCFQGKLSEAEPLCREALVSMREQLGNKHPHTLKLISNLATVLRSQGKLCDAEPFYREAVTTTRELFGNQDPRTLKLINNLTTLLRTQGKLSDAESFCLQSLDMMREELGRFHPHTLTCVWSLSLVLEDKHDLAVAVQLREEVLQCCREIYGDYHPETQGVQALVDDIRDRV